MWLKYLLLLKYIFQKSVQLFAITYSKFGIVLHFALYNSALIQPKIMSLKEETINLSRNVHRYELKYINNYPQTCPPWIQFYKRKLLWDIFKVLVKV